MPPELKICEWFGLPVTDRQTDIEGNHRDLYACKAALTRALQAKNAEIGSLTCQLKQKDDLISAYKATYVGI